MRKKKTGERDLKGEVKGEGGAGGAEGSRRVASGVSRIFVIIDGP